MPTRQKLGRPPSSAVIWRLLIFLNPPRHLHLQCCPLAVHWLQASGAVNLVPKWGRGWRLPLGGNVELLNGACVPGTDSYQGGGNAASDMAQSRVSVRVYGESQCSITMQITALHFSVVYMLLPLRANLCICTGRYSTHTQTQKKI